MTERGADTGYMFDREAETMARDDIEALQVGKLQRALDNAYANVPHYRGSFDAAGVKPDDLKSLDDLRRFPFTVKTDLRDNYPFNMFAKPREELIRIHASSGTTGKPTVVGYTKKDLEVWSNLMARSMACAGARPGDLIHNAYGYGLFTGGLGAHYGGEALGCTVVPVSGGATERQVQLLNDFGSDILCCTPSYGLNIAEVADRMGIDMRKLPVRRGIMGAEPWSDEMRVKIQEALGIKAVDIYGLSEILGPGVACECDAAQAGLHAWEDHFIFEVLDTETLEPVGDGEPGELVITTLSKDAMPMIRYRTRDITRMTAEPCVCGRTHRRILRFTGRNDDMMIIRGVNVYPSQVEAVLVGLPGTSPHYQIMLTREGSLDTMLLEVEIDPGADGGADNRTRLGKEVEHHIKSMIGVTCTVVMKGPGEVPRSEGKAVRVRDLRK